MPIKVLVNGAFGRMGQMTTKAINEHPLLELVGQTGREYDLSKAIVDSQAQVVVDFTHPEAVFNNACLIIANGAHPVIGTSGLSLSQIQQLQEQCATLSRGGIVAPNFSLGAVLMMKYAKEIIRYLPEVEIIEMHHAGKLDSPSGTALRTAEMLHEARHLTSQVPKQTKENVPGARGALYHDIPIHAIRLPGLLAHQEIMFGGHGETLTLRHDSIDRQAFMPGVCLACERVVTLKHLVYGLEEIL